MTWQAPISVSGKRADDSESCGQQAPPKTIRWMLETLHGSVVESDDICDFERPFKIA